MPDLYRLFTEKRPAMNPFFSFKVERVAKVLHYVDQQPKLAIPRSKHLGFQACFAPRQFGARGQLFYNRISGTFQKNADLKRCC